MRKMVIGLLFMTVSLSGQVGAGQFDIIKEIESLIPENRSADIIVEYDNQNRLISYGVKDNSEADAVSIPVLNLFEAGFLSFSYDNQNRLSQIRFDPVYHSGDYALTELFYENDMLIRAETCSYGIPGKDGEYYEKEIVHFKYDDSKQFTGTTIEALNLQAKRKSKDEYNRRIHQQLKESLERVFPDRISLKTDVAGALEDFDLDSEAGHPLVIDVELDGTWQILRDERGEHIYEDHRIKQVFHPATGDEISTVHKIIHSVDLTDENDRIVVKPVQFDRSREFDEMNQQYSRRLMVSKMLMISILLIPVLLTICLIFIVIKLNRRNKV